MALTKRLGFLFLVGLVSIVLALPVQPAVAQTIPSGTINLRVQTPVYQFDANGVRVPGDASNDRPGAPALPVWSTIVELPPNGHWEIGFQTPGARLLDQTIDVPAVLVPELAPLGPHGWAADVDLPGAVPTVNRPDPAIYGMNAFYPDSLVVPGEVQWQRGRRLLALRVFPFSYNPVTRRLMYHPDIRITIQVTPGEAAGDLDPRVGAGVSNSAAMTTGALRIRTGARGLYRLTYDNLQAAHVPLASTDVATFAMSYLGEPVAVEVTGDGDNRFESGELVIFYAEPYRGRYQTSNVYWFTYGGADGLRIDSRSVITGTQPLVTTITQTLHVELNNEYRSDYPRPQDADHWFDTPLSPDVLAGSLTVTRTYDLALDDVLTTGTVQLHAALHGGADRPANPDKSIAIRLNGHSVGTYQWEGLTYTTVNASVPAVWLDGAPNRVHLVAALSQLPGIDFYSVSPDWVEVTYPALADAEGDRIYVESVAAGANEVAVTGFTTSTVQVYDVRDPLRPMRLLTTQAVEAGLTYTLHFWDANIPSPSYFLSTKVALAAPLAIEPDVLSTWRTPGNAADYIAIVHSSLWNPIQSLLDHRAAEGLRIAKVDVQDIYDEFSFGLRDPEAIRSFLSYAYHSWNGAGARPQYVLLVGDGHYDFTGVSGTSLPNLIPPYLIAIDPWLGETASDNRYASVDGPGDYLPDMAIGRIPATNAADVTAVVNKIIAYETVAPAGAWQERVIFVADNYLDPAGNFHAFSDNVRQNWLPAAYDDRMIYYNRDYFSGSAMRTAIKAAFNDDAFLVQWFGHGSRFRWGSVSMFNSDDPETLAANDTWPVTIAYSCWSGYFMNLVGGWQSLGETLVLTPQRGSVADLSPSGLHVGDALLVLDQGLTQAVFSQRIERVGQAVDAAKEYYFGHAGSFLDVIDTSVLFGDPALKLRLPTASLATSTATVKPTQAVPGEVLHYTVTVQNTGASTLSEVVVTMDYAEERGHVIVSNPPAVVGDSVLTWTVPNAAPGATNLTFDLQLDTVQPAGVTAIHAPTAVQAYGFTWANLDPVSAVSAAPQLGASSLVVSRAWAPPTYPLTYTLTLSNTGNALSAATWLTVTLPTDLISVTSPSLIYDPPAHRLTWQGPVPVRAPVVLTFNGVVSPARKLCGQLPVVAVLRDELSQTTALAKSVDLAVPDVDCDGGVDVADVQHVAAHWGATQGNLGYDPRYDLDGDDAIGVLDLVRVATQWN